LSLRYEIYAREPAGADHTNEPPDQRTLERAALNLENFLTQSPQIQK
jgi:hypothetical protein